jgi:DNA mismatch repair protein MutS
MEDQDLTPMMRQYHAVKQETPDALLFFRLGDFYELFLDDAITASRELEITLTARNKDREKSVPMCGVPYHAADGYIARLLRKGYKVAICDQMEAAQKGVKLVKREITRIITPGTITDTNVLSPGENNFLLAISDEDGQLGCAFLDVSTGALSAAQFAGGDRWNHLLLDIEHFSPREILFPEKLKEQIPHLNNGIAKTPMDDWLFDADYAARILHEQFGTATLDGFGLTGKGAAIGASGAMMHYVRQTQKTNLSHITGLTYSESANYLVLDAATIRNLELFEPSSPFGGDNKDSLLGAINRTRTGMGARLLRNWLVRPSIDRPEIELRLDAVGEIAGSTVLLEETRTSFEGLFDLERLLSKITVGTGSPRELTALRASIGRLPGVAAVLDRTTSGRFVQLREQLDLLSDLGEFLAKAISDDPPFVLADGGVIREGYHPGLDELRSLSKNSKTYLAALETRERERTGIGSLKVRFNRVFGYYIEISKANLHLAPKNYDRKQTLVGAERFVTPELKEYEEKILTAEEKILEIEKTLFQEIRSRIAGYDVLAGFAATAQRFGYSRPQISNNDEFVISKGRHPVIEALAEEHRADRFVPNDLFMNDSADQILIMTGPNMGGKSTFLRQNALLVILAQMGSFVPAQLMRFPIFDRIFTRIGASDNLARGRSTFMVEMTETAIILNSATPRSLVILDEIGRGTATFDGLSLAWAVIEHIQLHLHAKTIFATHYHELTELADLMSGIKNYHVAVKESQNRIIFLRTVETGAADRSYGIEVAKLAGIPAPVIERAREILKKHEESEHKLSDNLTVRAGRKPRIIVNQLSLFTALEEELRDDLRQIDVDRLTPLEGLKILADLKKKAEKPS